MIFFTDFRLYDFTTSMPIYTRTGDKGTTSLYGGRRILKSDLQIEAYGSIDELNSFAGMVAVIVKNKSDRDFLIDVQRDLHKIMASLSGAKVNLDFIDKRISKFEERIDELDKKLSKLTRFILPGGTVISSWLHILRVICRRAERKVIRYSRDELQIIKYLNRLSDLFFTMARKYGQKNEIVL